MDSGQANEFEARAVDESNLTPWPRVAAVAALVGFSLPTFITGVELAKAMPAGAATAAIGIGCVIIFGVGAGMGAIGAKTRLSSYLLTRIAFGDKGAGFVNLAFAVSLLGWFGVNINLFSEALSGLSEILLGTNLPESLSAVMAAALITLTTYAGFHTINLLSSLMTPVLAFVTGLLLYRTLSDNQVEDLMSTEIPQVLSVGEGAAAIVGAIIIGAIILPDITRFVRHWSGAIGVAFAAYVVVQITVMIAAAYAATATGAESILDILVEYGLGLGAFLIVISGSWVLNTLNLYSTVLSVKATFPALPNALTIAVLGALGTATAFLDLLDHFILFLTYLSILFVPIAGIILIDFLVVRPNAYRVETLECNAAIRPGAYTAWLTGSLVAFAGQLQLYDPLSGIGVIDAILIASFVHTAIAFLGAPNRGGAR